MQRTVFFSKALLGLALVFIASPVLAKERCDYVPPQFQTLVYAPGMYLPVYFSRYQLSLPGEPAAFLSSNGFIAVYPDHGYVGIEHVAQRDGEAVAPKLAPGLTSVSQYYRLIYGAPTSVTAWDDNELSLQRSILGLNCHSTVAFYRVDGVEVIFHKSSKKQGIDVIAVLNGDDVELITIRGVEGMARQVIASIKRRL